MKNVHLLPTDKPSRLFKLAGDLHLHKEHGIDHKRNQHIYITSDEEINQQTKPCWCINTIKNTWNDDLIYYQGAMPQYHFKGFKKIILTTDQDLIKDGVQAINDEFLEWFVKNPSCEHVTILQKGTTTIIFPTPKNDIISDFIKKEESKQETLEEVAQRIFSDFGDITKPSAIKRALELTKWQAERMYSEEEIIKILIEYDYSKINDDKLNSVGIVKKWFEQFKKK